MTIDSEEVPFDGSVSIPHFKTLWKLLKQICKEFFAPRINAVKVLTVGILGVTYIPQFFPYPMHFLFSFSLRILYISCWYLFAMEFPWLLLRFSDQRTMHYWLICGLVIPGIWHYLENKID